MPRFKIEYVIWISIVSFSIIISFQHNLKELMLPHQLLTAPLISALHDKVHPFPFINTLPIYFFWENCQPPLFNKPPTIRGRRIRKTSKSHNCNGKFWSRNKRSRTIFVRISRYHYPHQQQWRFCTVFRDEYTLDWWDISLPFQFGVCIVDTWKCREVGTFRQLYLGMSHTFQLKISRIRYFTNFIVPYAKC